jgi:hypothetical protein
MAAKLARVNRLDKVDTTALQLAPRFNQQAHPLARSSRPFSSTFALSLAIASGFALSGACAWLARREPEPASALLAFVPLALILTSGFGYIFPVKPWRWAVTIHLTLLPILMLHGEELSSLPGLSLVLLVFSLVGTGLASLAARFRLRR